MNIRYVVKKFVKWRNGIAPKIVELIDQIFERLVSYGRCRNGRRFIRKKVAIVRRCQLSS
jgi:hypothetical protein